MWKKLEAQIYSIARREICFAPAGDLLGAHGRLYIWILAGFLTFVDIAESPLVTGLIRIFREMAFGKMMRFSSKGLHFFTDSVKCAETEGETQGGFQWESRAIRLRTRRCNW